MNHRLDELFVRAGGQFGHYGEPILPDIAKFAELIVRECLDQCYNNGMNDALYKGQLKAASYIEKHFGVEE